LRARNTEQDSLSERAAPNIYRSGENAWVFQPEQLRLLRHLMNPSEPDCRD
jgi:hypothetical protein